MKRILCWIIGHEWKFTHIDLGKRAALAHLHPLAGTRAECRRCKKIWNDLREGTLENPEYWELKGQP